MENIEKERAFIAQHRKDAENTINKLKTMKCNILLPAGLTWEQVVETRIKHCESFIKSLVLEEKRFEHFK